MKNSEMLGEYKLYFDWLMEIAGVDGDFAWDIYENTLIRLFIRKYYWLNPLDENSALHAYELRSRAIKETEIPLINIPNGEASILEVLIALAIRVDTDIMYNPEYFSRVPQFFHDIFHALGFGCSGGELEERIDAFLDGENVIFDFNRRLKPGEKTLWQQVNGYYKTSFELENDIW